MTDTPEDRLINQPIRTIRQSDIAACPFMILVPSHYRADGTCKCSNADHRNMMIAEWGYFPEDFTAIPVID